jgi:hypothetical protein
MTAANTTVKYYHSAMSGVATLNGTAGSLISVLDACLVTGFNLKTADSVVVAGGIATLTISAGIGSFEPDVVALIAGATPSGLNGEKRIISTTTNTITFDATGISDQTATGTITAKLAPAGWEKVYSGTNLAAYRSADLLSTRNLLRVDDTGTTNARVVGYETMTDVSTGNGVYPTNAQVPGGLYWAKADSANATARAWTLIADNKTFYLHTNTHTTSANLGNAGGVVGFGDTAAFKSNDLYSCHIQGYTSDASGATGQRSDSFNYNYNSGQSAVGLYLSRSYTGIGAAISCGKRPENYGIADGTVGGVAHVQWPNGADNALLLSRVIASEYPTSGVHTLRGALRGLLAPMQNCATSFGWRDKLDGQGSYAGRKLLAIKGHGGPAENVSGNAATGCVIFDITGPWG